MGSTINLPILEELIPGGIDFRYGTIMLVEFESDSIWYETSLTIAAQALGEGIRTDYHTFQHHPSEIREALAKLAFNLNQLEEQNAFRIIDSYTISTGIGSPEKFTDGKVPFQAQSLKLSDWSIAAVQEIKRGASEVEKERLHLDDNTSVMLQYNEEKVFIDYFRTRNIPRSRQLRASVLFPSLVTGVSSEAFYRQMELLCDGVIDFRSEEKKQQIEHNVRVRLLRGRPYDSRWRRLHILQNGEVTLAD